MKKRKWEIGSRCADCKKLIDPRSYRCRSCRTKKLYKDGVIKNIIPIDQRFWNKVKKTKSCWIWGGCKDKNGYGRIGIGKKNLRTHRFSYELNIGKITEGLFVLHKCDNPSCVNPEHLKVGTHKENQHDKSIRRRISGKRNPNYRHGKRIKK